MSSSTKLLALLVALTVLLVPALALAQKPAQIHVIALDSDDASEDQADALTSALRARFRNAPTFQLADSNQSLSTLLPALKCPQRPDSACLQRIGDQLKTDRFVWGYVVKAPIPHQVVAEVHLWTRGRPEQVAKETYSDNLKDQNDDALRRVAGSLFEHLTGQATQGTIVVKATGTQTGTVVVDGKPMGQLDHGQTTLLVSSGPHSVEVQADGLSAPAQNVDVAVNTTSEISFDLKAAAVGPAPGPSGPSHTKRLVGFILLGVGGAAAITAGIVGGLYFGGSDASAYNDWYHAHLSEIVNSNACTNASSQVQQIPGQASACSARDRADTLGDVAWAVAGGAAALITGGIILIMTDRGGKEGSASGTSFRVTPTFSPYGGGVSALLTF